jgi:hypothetical protein
MPDSNQVDGQPEVTPNPLPQGQNGQPPKGDDAPKVDPDGGKAQGVAPPNGSKSTFRGPLRYEVETSSPTLEAGKIFSIFLRITNPYDVPVMIRLVGFALPVEFDDETDHRESLGQIMPWSRSRAGPGKDGTTGTGIAQDGGGANPFGSNVAIAVGINKRPGGTSKAQDKLDEDPLTGAAVTIQPGNTVFRKVSIRTHKWLLFSPAVYNVEASISYVMDQQLNHDAVKVPLSIKAPLWSLIAGAAVGAIGGSLFQLLRNDKGGLDDLIQWAPSFHIIPAAALRFVIGLLSSLLLSAIVIVAFARKKDAQPFVSVEDFYGGLFIGFMVGINGAAWVNFIGNGAAPGGVSSVSPVASAPK